MGGGVSTGWVLPRLLISNTSWSSFYVLKKSEHEVSEMKTLLRSNVSWFLSDLEDWWLRSSCFWSLGLWLFKCKGTSCVISVHPNKQSNLTKHRKQGSVQNKIEYFSAPLEVHQEQEAVDRWERFVQSISLGDISLTPCPANMGHHQFPCDRCDNNV